MHEWALAESVVESVREECEKNGGRSVLSVKLLFGELQNIDKDIFFEGLSEFLADLPFSADVFHIETEPVLFACRACEREWGFADLKESGPAESEREAIHFIPESACAYIACPSCGVRDFSVKKGRGVTIEAIEIERD
ncbi:MAG: hydrogenase nickel incorporation protein HypA [Spirochaetales bacterium]|nr:MAG: hydrogenase nickel incorporation protein HypA [Spirochaetales bacterium]